MKHLKYLFIILLFIPFIVYADDLEITSMDKNKDSYGVLYSNGDLLFHYDSDTTYNNIKKFNVLNSGRVIYLTNDNKFYDSYQLKDNIKEYITVHNQEYGDYLYYIDNSNNLYYTIPGSSNDDLRNGILKATNVKEVKAISNDNTGEDTTVLYLDNNNDLYFFGYNYFGTKINDGNPSDTPIKLLENINYFSYLYAVDNSNNLYLFSSSNPRPTISAYNVSKVIEDPNSKYFIGYNFVPLVIKHLDNSYELYNGIYGFISINVNVKKVSSKFMLSEDNKLYYFTDDGNKLAFIDDNVKDINLFNNGNWVSEEYFYGYLKNNNEVYYLSDRYDYDYYYDSNYNELESTLMKKMYQNDRYGKNLYFLKNVKNISFAYRNLILLNDNTILFMDNDNQYHLLNQLNDTINNNKEFKTKQIYLSFKGKYDYSVDDEFDAFATVIPYNATNKELVWESSNTAVATVDNEGFIKAKTVGQTVITVKTSDNTVSESATITIHPKVTGIEIENGDTIEVGSYDRLLLTANVYPDDALEKDVIWEILDRDDDHYSYLDDYYIDSKIVSNKKYFYAYDTGTYRVKVSTENKKFSDIITINVVQKVTDIYFDSQSDSYDGGSGVYIYLSESNNVKMDANVYPESATNKQLKWTSSDTNIAEVSQDGLITAKAEGNITITVESVDGNYSRSLYVHVYQDRESYYDPNETYTLTQTNASTKSVDLKWRKKSNADGYLVQVKSGKKWKTVATIKNNSTTTKTIKKLKAGKKYTYRVVSYINVKKKKKTVKETIYTTDSIVAMTSPSAPKAVIKGSTYNTVQVGYKKVSGGYRYIVYRSFSKSGGFLPLSYINGVYTDTNLKTGVTYYYKVKACNENGFCSGYSKVVSKKPSLSKPSLSVKSTEKGKVLITPGSVPGESGYVIEYSTKSKKGFKEVVSLDVETLSYLQEELKSKKTYYYRVRAYRKVGNSLVYSSWSKTKKVKVK